MRNHELALSPELMDVILSATSGVREMFSHLERGSRPPAADAALLAALQRGLQSAPSTPDAPTPIAGSGEPDWDSLYAAVVDKPSDTGAPEPSAQVAVREVQPRNPGRRATDQPDAEGARAGRRDSDRVAVSQETTIRIDITNRVGLHWHLGLNRRFK